MKRSILILFSCFCSAVVAAQSDTIFLSFDNALRIANDSSLQSFRAKNLYMSSYWSYKNYESQKLPSISLNTTPLKYYSQITQITADSGYIYSPYKYLSSYGNIQINQNLPFSGGSVYANSNLTRFENLGSNNYTNYIAKWFSVGYKQPIFGFNQYKWLRKTAPLEYDIAKKEYIQSRETVSLSLIPIYFNMAYAELSLKIAQQNLTSADTLYQIGLERYKLTTVDKADLLTLKLELVNSRNSLSKAESNYVQARDALLVFLRFESEKQVKLELPESLPEIYVPTDKALDFATQNNPEQLDWELQMHQADKSVEKAKVDMRFNASVDASVGFEQQASELHYAYIDPNQQPNQNQLVTLKVTIPILDWGQRKSYYHMAQNNREATMISIEQQRQDFDQELKRMVSDFNLQARIVASSKEAAEIAKESYEINKQRFLMGRIDVNTLGLQQNSKDNALRGYLSELQKFWQYYYNIRKLTLYDLENGQSLIQTFEQNINYPEPR